MAQFTNYLRSHRKRLALSQEEVAFLLGVQSGAKVSRYEQFARVPSLETALAFKTIFQRPASELFAGLNQKVQQEVATRAQALLSKGDGGKPKPRTVLRQKMLTGIINKSLTQTT